ncbi:hypothetical protein GECvBN6_gp150 [Salmonella phage GEC_vB_N6]|nr:hypothetical protein GECvBN6_gp150 [Salmonella phage GEC_vB_N6]
MINKVFRELFGKLLQKDEFGVTWDTLHVIQSNKTDARHEVHGKCDTKHQQYL